MRVVGDKTERSVVCCRERARERSFFATTTTTTIIIIIISTERAQRRVVCLSVYERSQSMATHGHSSFSADLHHNGAVVAVATTRDNSRSDCGRAGRPDGRAPAGRPAVTISPETNDLTPTPFTPYPSSPSFIA